MLGRRGDGYHDLETAVLPISLADRIEVHAVSNPTQFRTLSLSLEITGEPDMVRRVPADESNLALRAARVLAERAGIRGFAEIHMQKEIPVAAGLGGGSADAAATLSALNDLWGASLEPGELSSIAAELGSDVPAMLRGPSLIRGRGEDVIDLRAMPFHWVLVTFDFGVSTKEAYGWWDEDGGGTGPDPGPVLEALQAGPAELGPVMFNDLEGPVARRHPRIAEAKRVLLGAGAAGAVMAGSGSCVVGLLPTAEPLSAQVEDELERLSGRPVGYVTSPGIPPE